MKRKKTNNRKALLYSVFSICALASIEVNATPVNVLYENEIGSQIKDQEDLIGNPSQMAVGGGIIYPVVDVLSVTPKLSVEVNANPILKPDSSLKEGKLSFQVTTNYGDYIKKYELSFYDMQDSRNSQPIKVITGETLKNEDTIVWDGTSNIRLDVNKQLKYVLKVYDKDGIYDETSIGVITFREEKIDISNLSIEKEDSDKAKIELLKQNIQAQYGKVTFIGKNIENISEIKIDDDKYTISSNTSNISIDKLLSPGSHDLQLSVKLKNGKEELKNINIIIPETMYLGVGVADLVIGHYDTKGNELNKVDEYDGKIFKKGRLAYYGTGVYKKDLRFILQADTEEQEIDSLFDGIFRKQKDDVYNRLNEDDYYQIYGDDSIISTANSYLQQGKIYAEVGFKKSRALWGTYSTGLSDTELAVINKSLYGGLIEAKSSGITEFGDNRYSSTLYAAQAETGHGRNEFLGTGGSLYLLKHGDVIKDSEILIVEVRNKTTGLVELTIPLQEGIDYEINDYQGRITLVKPLSQFATDNMGSIIKDDLQNNTEYYLIAEYDYEYTASEATKNMSYGGRLKGWLGNNIALGTTYSKEQRDESSDYELLGGDLTLKYSQGTYLKAEVAKTKSIQIENNYISYNGGLEFSDIRDTTISNEGTAYSIIGNVNLSDVNSKVFSTYGNEIQGWYKVKESGFSMGALDEGRDSVQYGAQLKLKPATNLNIITRYSEDNSETDDKESKVDTRTAIAQVEYFTGDKFTLTGALSDVKEVTEASGVKVEKEATLLAGKLNYKYDDDLSLWGIAQTTLRERNYTYSQIYTLGASKEFFKDKLKLRAEYSIADNKDDNLTTRIELKPFGSYSVYAGYSLINDNEGKSNKLVFGQNYQVTKDLGIYSEHQLLKDPDARSTIEAYGVSYKVKDNYTLGIAYQQGVVNENTGESYKRRAVSLSSSYDKSKFKLTNKFEYRIDNKSSSNEETYVTTNGFSVRLTDSLRGLANFDYSISRDRETDETIERYSEVNIGFAFRPVTNNRLAILGRYRNIKEEDNTSRINVMNEKKEIFEAEINYKLSNKWSIGGRIAYKDAQEYYTTELGDTITIDNNAELYGVRLEYDVMRTWSGLLEYRFLRDRSTGDLSQGALLGVYRRLGDNLKVGAGYNFSRISDDIAEDNFDARGWFINIIGKM